MTDITIPREALEAARVAFVNAGTADDDTDPIRAACLAMLKAWPGVSKCDARQWSVMPDMPIIILPLPENSNDKG